MKTTLRVLLLISAIIFLVKVYAIIRWGDVDWEPDSYMHFLELETIFTNFPKNIPLGLGVWTKPLYAYPFGFLVYVFNVHNFWFIQTLNILITLLIGLFSYLTLRLFNVSKTFATFGFILVNISFLMFRSSVSALTEPIFTLMLAVGYYFMIKKKYLWASFFVGISVLGRIEGLLFVGLLGLWILFQKIKLQQKLYAFIILALPTIIWNLLGTLYTGKLIYLFDKGYPKEAGVYGFGSIFFYFKGLAKFEILISALLALAIIFYIYRYFRTKKLIGEFNRYTSLITFIIFFSIQTFLWTFGLFGTAGIMRYFVSVMPFAVIASILAVTDILEYFKVSSANSIRYMSILIVLQIILTAGIIALDGRFSERTQPYLEPGLEEAGLWLEQNTSKSDFLYSDRPEVIYYTSRNLNNAAHRLNPHFKRNDPGYYSWSKVWGPLLGVEKKTIDEKAKLQEGFSDYVYIYKLP